MRQNLLSLPIALILSPLLHLTILSVPSPAIASGTSDPRQDQIKKIESKLSTERRKLKMFDLQEKGLLDELAGLEQEIAAKRAVADALGRQIYHSKADIDELSRTVEGLKQSAKNVEARISRKLVEMYKRTRIEYVRALADVTDISQFWRRLKYLKAITKKDREALMKGAEEAKKQQREIWRSEAKLTKAIRIRNENETRLGRLKVEVDEKVLRLMNIHKEKEFYETSVFELQTAAEDLRQTLTSIEKKDHYEVNPSCHFEGFKGKLPSPLQGKAIGDPMHPKSVGPGTDKGIVIEAAPGTNVRAVFPGRVAFSGRLKGYGELVIINHGSRFFTVSAHLSVRHKMEGDLVKGGDIIGRVGQKGAPGREGFYFEIRRAGESLNPLTWLRAQEYW